MDLLDVRGRRFAAQRLNRPLDAGGLTGLTGLVRHLVAVQAQDPAAFPLALRARLPGLTASDVAKARADRTLVRCWGPRGTLHLVGVDDLTWLYPLVKPVPATSVRRLRQMGADLPAEAVTEVVDGALRGQGPLTKPELGARLARAGLPVTGQGIVHAAMLAAGRGLVVLGPEEDGKPTYVHAADWLGAQHSSGVAPGGDLPSVRLIPAYDEYLLGWRTRDHAVPEPFRPLVHPGGGIIKSAVLVDGAVAGTWQFRRTTSRVDISVTGFAPLPDAARPALEAEAADIGAFLECDVRLTSRVPAVAGRERGFVAHEPPMRPPALGGSWHTNPNTRRFVVIGQRARGRCRAGMRVIWERPPGAVVRAWCPKRSEEDVHGQG